MTLSDINNKAISSASHRLVPVGGLFFITDNDSDNADAKKAGDISGKTDTDNVEASTAKTEEDIETKKKKNQLQKAEEETKAEKYRRIDNQNF